MSKCNNSFATYLDILGQRGEGAPDGFRKNVRTVDVVWTGTIPLAGLTNAPVQLNLTAGNRTRPTGPFSPDGTMNAASKAIVTHIGAVVDYEADLTTVELLDLMRTFGSSSFKFDQNNNPLHEGILGAYANSQGTRQGDGVAAGAPESLMPFGPLKLVELEGKPIVEPTETVTAEVAGSSPAVAADHILAVVTRMVVGDKGRDY